MKTCGGCTACCEGNLLVTIEGQELEPGKVCQYCTVGQGCQRHDDQPEKVCSEFQCGWMLDNDMPDEWRPDRIGAIVVPNVYRWMNMPVDGLTPVNASILPGKATVVMNYLEGKKRLLILNKLLPNKQRVEFPVGPELFQQTFAKL